MGLIKLPNKWILFDFYVPPPAPLQVTEKITINIKSLVGKAVINIKKDSDIMKEKVIAALQNL